jgi:iron(III) transport system substrate-binding protein
MRIARNWPNMKHLIATVCFAVTLSFGVGILGAQDANVISAAKREGRVVWYSVAGESQQLAREFEKKYPFVKVEVVRSTVYPLLTRIFNETRAGNYLFDVVRQSTFTIGVLIEKGLMQPYDARTQRL